MDPAPTTYLQPEHSNAGRIERESDTSLELLIQEVMKVLEDAGGVIEEQPESFVGKLGRMRQSWSGLIKINIHHPEVVGDNQSELVLIICREAISNAFRHGKASHMDISFSTSNSTLNIRCEDDGLGPTKGKAGFGSELFELTSHSSLTAKENGGAVVEININD